VTTRRRVLLIEDNFVIALATRALLEDEGWEVTGPVASVAEALVAADDAWDCAIVDLDLRGESAVPVAEALQARGCPFVLLSGAVDGAGAASLGDDVPRLSKPVDPRRLLAALGAAQREPAQPPPARPSASPRGAPRGAAAPFAGKRVLIVEDNFLVAASTAEMIRRLGCHALGPVATPADALSALSDDCDAVLLDLNLRGESSLPVAEALQERGLPFAFVTGYQEGWATKGMENVPRLLKPVTPGLIRETLALLLA